MSAPDIATVTALRAQLWDAGFRPVPVFNADAGVASPGKQPLGKAWQIDARGDPPFCATSPAVAYARNTGILCDGLRPIDYDIDDRDLAHQCRAIAVGMFGEAPIRTRRGSSRCLMLYRAAVGEPSKIVLSGRLGKIEVLGRGQQFVAFGMHPSGVELEWFPDPPGSEPIDALPAVTENGIADFLAACAPIIDAPLPARGNGHDHAGSEPQADTLRIAAALASIPNSGPPDWEFWNRVGMAVWRATGGSPAGWEAWNAWSARNGAYDPDATRKRWDHYATSPPTAIGAGSIFHMAKRHGRPDPRCKKTDAPESGSPDAVADRHEQPHEGNDPQWNNDGEPESPGAGLDALPDLPILKSDLPLVSQRLRDHLAAHHWLFERGGPARLVSFPSERDRQAEVHQLGVDAVVHAAHEVCRPYQIDRRGKRSNVTLPERVAKLYLALNGRWNLRPLHGICCSVLLDSDGSIHSHEGYHAPSGMWCTRAPPLTVPERPTKDEAVAALHRLRAAMRTFTFKGSPLVERDGNLVVDIEQKPGLCESAALCGLLTAVCRASLPLAPGVMIQCAVVLRQWRRQGPTRPHDGCHRPGHRRRSHRRRSR